MRRIANYTLKKAKPAGQQDAPGGAETLLPKAEAEPADLPPARTAVFVAHGMGQQVPFETIDLVVNGFAETSGDWTVDVHREVASLRVGQKDLRRVGLTLRRGGQTRRVDVFEAYWAPLTEGKTGIMDVLRFLVGGGLNGIKNGMGPFRRHLFNGERTFPPVRGAVLALLLALTTIASLVAMNLLAAGVVAGKVAGLPPALGRELTFGLLAFLAVAGVLGVWVVLAALVRTFDRRRVATRFEFTRRHALRDAGMAAFAFALGAATGVLLAGVATAGAYFLAPDPDLATRGLALGAVLVALGVAFLFVVRTVLAGLGTAAGVLAGAAAWMGATWLVVGLVAVAVLALLGAFVWFIVRFVRDRQAHPRTGRRDGSVAFATYAVFSTLAVAALVALAPGFGGGSALAEAAPGPDPRASARMVDALALLAGLALVMTALPLVRGTLASLLDLFGAAVGVALILLLVLALVPGAWGRPELPSTLAAWGLVFAVSWKVRGLLVQYLGDVAAYVSPHTLDKFADLRQAIHARVKDIADAVYAHKLSDGEFQYERVLVVGHSLGSVVTYDTLNALLLDDQHARERVRLHPHNPKPLEVDRYVAKRTRLLVTFGSPLARTAFVFGTQVGDRQAREALAALVQPLISQEDTRKHLRWVNVHAPADIISSRLTYYDLPDRSNPNPIEDVEDDDATTPLAAHVEYWGSAAVWRPVVEAAFAP